MHVRDCFISHASEDKDAVARPLAHALKEMGYDVWYDEFELEVGDSLPAKINEGLVGSRFGVVILSKRFFEKNWTEVELDGLVAKQVIGSERIILPVWHEIDEDYLESVNPMLASIVGVPSAPVEVAAKKIARRIDRRREAGSSAAALVTAQESLTAPTESEPERLVRARERVKIEYTDEELRQFHADGGSAAGPGWLSVIVGPTTLKDDLIDPTDLPAERLRDMVIEDQWRSDVLLNRHGVKASLDGFHSRFPVEHHVPPGYWLKVWQDGLMEFGETLALGPQDDRQLPYIAMAEWIHDYANLFVQILKEVGYLGDAVALANLGDVKGFQLGLPPGAYFPDQRPIDVHRVMSRPLRTSVTEMPGEINRWVKKTMDRFFLAAGIASGAFFLDENGLVERNT